MELFGCVELHHVHLSVSMTFLQTSVVWSEWRRWASHMWRPILPLLLYCFGCLCGVLTWLVVSKDWMTGQPHMIFEQEVE